MKRIIFILWLLSLSISSFAQDHYRRVIRYPSLGFSSFAQSTLKDSLMANPHIEGLIEYAKSLGLGVTTQENYRFEKLPFGHSRDGSIYFELYDIVREADQTEKPEMNRLLKEQDSIYKAWDAAGVLILDSIRNTFMALAPTAREIYMKEFHEENVDSIFYAYKAGQMANGKEDISVKNVFHRNGSTTSRSVLNVPEQMFFDYYTNPSYQKDVDEGQRYITRAVGRLSYNLRKDPVSADPPEFINVKEYEKMLKQVFNRKGITKQHLYTRKDENFILDRQRDQSFLSGYSIDRPWSSETQATIYTIRDRKLFEEVMKSFHEVTWQYIEAHPNTRCQLHGLSFSNNDIFKSNTEYNIDNRQEFQVIYRGDVVANIYRFVVFYSKMSRYGVAFLPMDWSQVKSWVNGKMEYYKGF
ncbi:MAG: hypothetical protein IKP41_04155 [Bacteroidaceae bacterium]|nr:hypothetical protein [Bacteroidaceae bacterium]